MTIEIQKPDVPHVLSFKKKDWEDLLISVGEPAYRAKQLENWIYQKKVLAIESMSNLPKTLRDKIGSQVSAELPEIISRLESEDGTTKLLLRGKKLQSIETVIMRYEDRTSLCVSSQVGCKLACTFCQTGKLGFFRNLSADEILSQYFIADQIVSQEGRRVSHIVFMGMGEPFDNYDNVIQATNRFLDEDGLNLSHKHVTLSTSGIAPKIGQLAYDTKACLALSLHAATDELRSQIMPINRKYSLVELKEELLAYQQATNKKITIEYILIKDVNCSIKEAKALVRYVNGLKVKINLIPFNDHPGVDYKRPDTATIQAFQDYLKSRSLVATVRYSRGLGVSAACGQLAAKTGATLSNMPRRKDILVNATTEQHMRSQ
ncbi:MAG: 23S rRNA (adenine(2503)-C(2))-methyltransferase RlmN [Oligoflexales bacterium]